MTRLLLVKLARDLRATWPRVALMIVAMGVTLLTFSAIFFAWGVASREIAREYSSTNPASATILLEEGLPRGEMAALVDDARRRPGILDAAARTQLTVRIRRDRGWDPKPLQLFVAPPDDALSIESLTVEQGRWPVPPGEFLIDRSSLDLLQLEVGDTVTVEAVDGRSVPLKIAGSVYYPALAPSFQEQKGHGFLSSSSLPALGAPLALDALKLRVAGREEAKTPSRDRDAIVAAARDVATWLEQARGLTVREIQVPTPYAHPHQRQADVLLLALLVFAAGGLLLSALLVAAMMNVLFTQQIPQIGIMKAIGARSSRIARLYLVMTSCISLAATALAIAPGVAVGRAFVAAMLALLGIEARDLVAPWWTFAVVVAVGVALPPLFALLPLFLASRITVREALDYRGAAQRGDRPTRLLLGDVRGLDRTLLLALRNALRRRARFALSVVLLSSAAAVFIGGASTVKSLRTSLERINRSRTWDVEVQLHDDNRAPASRLTELVARVAGVAQVEAWSVVTTSVAPRGQLEACPERSECFSVTSTWPDQGHGSVGVTVVPRESVSMAAPTVVEGRWLAPDETGAVVVSQALRASALPGVRSGDEIELMLGGRRSTWVVVGIGGLAQHGGGGIFMTGAGHEAAVGASEPNVLRIVTREHDEGARGAVAAAVERALVDAGARVRAAQSTSRAEAAGAGHMLPLILIFLALSIAMGLVGLVSLASAMSTNVLERTRELGVMRAIGASPAVVRRLVVAEGLFTVLVSCVVAVIPALLLTAAMHWGVGRRFPLGPLPLELSGLAVVIWVAFVVVGAVLATLAPASRAARVTVREALAAL